MTRKRDILFVCGPISSGTDNSVEEQLRRFSEAAKALEDAGYVVVNPGETEYKTEGMSASQVWQTYMRSSIRQVSSAGGLALLPGWQASRGASLEVFIATQLGIDCQPVLIWLKRAEQSRG